MWPKMWLEICVIYIPFKLEWEFHQSGQFIHFAKSCIVLTITKDILEDRILFRKNNFQVIKLYYMYQLYWTVD